MAFLSIKSIRFLKLFMLLVLLALFGLAFTLRRTTEIHLPQTSAVTTKRNRTISNNITSSTQSLVHNLQQQHQGHHQRMNTSYLLKLLETKRFNRSLAPSVFPKPPSEDNGIIAIYSKQAWWKLQNVLQMTTTTSNQANHANSTHPVTVCVNGGSSSASAGFVHRLDYQERYPQLLRQFLSNIHNKQRNNNDEQQALSVQLVDRAHGARNSLHSAFMMHSFLPSQHPHILLWEFSINDVLYDQTKNVTIMRMEARNQLILWLDQVVRVSRQRQSPPPLVIFIYLWNKNQCGVEPGLENPYQHIPPDLVFETHQHVLFASSSSSSLLAAANNRQYDFVVGHVHLGKYVMSLWNDIRMVRKHVFADSLHPNPLGHQLIFYLLQDLIMDEQRQERRRPTRVRRQPSTENGGGSSSSYVWACGDDTPQKRLLKELLQTTYPIASYTQEEPKNEELLPGMLEPSHVTTTADELQIQNLGKTDTLRQDRKYAATLPCCNTSVMTFEHVGQNGLVRGLQLSLFPDSNGLQLFLDDENVTDRIVDCSNTTEWECVLSDPFEIFYYWVVLETNRNVSNITMCNNLPTCGIRATRKQQQFVIPAPSLQALTVFGVI